MSVLSAVRHFSQTISDRLLGGARVLLYHRVADLESDPQWLAVSPANFEAQLAVLSRETNVVSLLELERLRCTGRLPRRTVVITFDDGYTDNLTVAAPQLAKARLPATVFVASAALRQERELYWDELDRLILHAPELPPRLTLALPGAEHVIDLASAASEPVAQPAAKTPWNATWPASTARQRCYLTLCELLKPLDETERQLAIGRLQRALGRADAMRPTHRLLDAAQLRLLAAMPGIEIGAHGVTHPMLSRLSDTRQAEEIFGGRRELQSILNAAVSSFAYPYGGREDFNQVSLRLVQEAGFQLACANFPGAVRAGTDAFMLPRVLVRDWKADEFRAQLSHWFSD